MLFNSILQSKKVSLLVIRSASSQSAYSSISDFYAGRSVFITGGTGFVGKAPPSSLHGNPHPQVLEVSPDHLSETLPQGRVLWKSQRAPQAEGGRVLFPVPLSSLFLQHYHLAEIDYRLPRPLACDHLGHDGRQAEVLLEKLLYHCSAIDKIYLLIRNKGRVNSDDRLRNILQEPIFQRLRDTRPNDFKKIVPVTGDLSQANLGISESNERNLIQDVSVIFHSAADVRFDSSMKGLLEMNVEGTRKIINFAKKFQNLQAYVHVSSAFSQSDKKVVDEKIYPLTDIKEIYSKADLYDADPIKYKSFLQGRSNSYCLTKAYGEHILADERENLPVVLLRPSIISPIYKDPLPGWLDNWFGFTGLLFSMSKGLVHVYLGKKNNIAALIPVDYVANSLIVAAARYEKNSEIPVYNVCSSYSAPVTVSQIIQYSSRACKDKGFNVLPRGVIYTESKPLVKLVDIAWDVPLTFLLDCWQSLRKKEQRYFKFQRYINLQRDYINPFTNNSWVYKSSNLEKLDSTLSAKEREIFGFNAKDIDWQRLTGLYMEGVHQYLYANKNGRN